MERVVDHLILLSAPHVQLSVDIDTQLVRGHGPVKVSLARTLAMRIGTGTAQEDAGRLGLDRVSPLLGSGRERCDGWADSDR